jgi:hypothetical protein
VTISRAKKDQLVHPAACHSAVPMVLTQNVHFKRREVFTKSQDIILSGPNVIFGKKTATYASSTETNEIFQELPVESHQVTQFVSFTSQMNKRKKKKTHHIADDRS